MIERKRTVMIKCRINANCVLGELVLGNNQLLESKDFTETKKKKKMNFCRFADLYAFR